MSRRRPKRSQRAKRSFLGKFAIVTLLLLLAVAGSGWWYFHPAHTGITKIIYAHRRGHDLTLDVIRPDRPNGAAVLLMVSGGWQSEPEKFHPWMAASFLRQGLTIVAVSHVSQPQASIMEIVEDVHRAVRFVRYHAEEYGIDPQRLGVMGGSSGGHLGLMLATCGAPGNPVSNDPVDRESSAVQAATVFYPVTDLLNLGPSTQNLHDGGPPKSFRNSFGPYGTDPAAWRVIGRDVSPIYHITSSLPPVYIIHGSEDTLVPLEQSQRFQQQAASLGKKVSLLVRPGKEHGWYTILWDAHLFALWMAERLS